MITRHITSLIQSSLRDFPVVLVIGARQVGKSTLCEQILKAGLLDYHATLDDFATLEAARADPDAFLASYGGPLVLDEVQRVPDLLRALKKNIDQDRRPGRFLLTGSANILSYPGVTESLAGRMDIIYLEGLSMGELYERPQSSLLLQLLQTELSSVLTNSRAALQKDVSKAQLYKWIFYGGFPEVALKQSTPFSQRWFASYLTSYIERDIRDLTKLIDAVPFSKLLRLASLRTGNLLNVKNLGADAGIDQRTASRYLSLLELTFQVNQLSPWHSSQRKRLVKTPKLYLNDSGLACFLTNIPNPEALEQHPFCGALFETWIWSEMRKLLALHTGIQYSYYRTHQGHEVDFVLEYGQKILGIEVKLTSRVTYRDFSGLLDLQTAVGKKIVGIIFYTGDTIVSFADNLVALPLQCLWSR